MNLELKTKYLQRQEDYTSQKLSSEEQNYMRWTENKMISEGFQEQKVQLRSNNS